MKIIIGLLTVCCFLSTLALIVIAHSVSCSYYEPEPTYATGAP